MTPATRGKLIIGLLALSVVYALLVGWNLELARVIAVGYIALMLTVLVIVNIWKKPPHG